MDIESMFAYMPYNREVGIEITEAADGYAEGRIELEERHSSSPNTMVAHGGVAYTLADTGGGAAVISQARTVTPTIDMRIDYLAPGTGETMLATDEEDRRLATARGTYKTGGDPEGSAWSDEHDETRLSDADGE